MAEEKVRPQSLFQVAVLHRDPKSGKTTVVIEPDVVTATSAETARLSVIRQVPADYDEKLDDLEVIVRPF